MNRDAFVAFARQAVARAVSTDGHMGQLVYTQKASNQPKLREPEMQFAFGYAAEAEGLPYGVEVPTDKLYRFTKEVGTDKRRGCLDFVILDAVNPEAERLVLVEFKEGQPGTITDGRGAYCPAITKDLHKLLLEPSADGKCMLHMCHAANSGTVRAVLAKYDAALRRAVEDARADDDFSAATASRVVGWFEFLLLIGHQRGKVGEDRPCLYHLSFVTLEHAARAVLAGESAFQQAQLVPVPLTVG